jgi:hypothetical protein
MFGRHQDKGSGQEEPIQVDAALESDVARVEHSVGEYLHGPTDAARRNLLVALEALEDQTDRSDAYEESVLGSGALGYSSKGEVLGETDIDSVVDEVSSSELRAQVALVHAAKNEIRGPTPDTFAVLQSASATLVAVRDRASGG